MTSTVPRGTPAAHSPEDQAGTARWNDVVAGRLVTKN
jgi:hypothetical protein